MKNFELSDNEIDVIRYSLSLLKKDCNFDLETYVRHGNLDAISECVETISTIDFLQNKIKF